MEYIDKLLFHIDLFENGTSATFCFLKFSTQTQYLKCYVSGVSKNNHVLPET